MRRRGQVIVELALAMPVLLFTILGGIEAGFLLIAKADQDRATQVVADWAVFHPGESWNSVANQELPGCTVTVDESSRDVVEAASRCQYRPKVLVGMPLFDGLPISSHETAAVRVSKSPEPTPVASPSS